VLPHCRFTYNYIATAKPSPAINCPDQLGASVLEVCGLPGHIVMARYFIGLPVTTIMMILIYMTMSCFLFYA